METNLIEYYPDLHFHHTYHPLFNFSNHHHHDLDDHDHDDDESFFEIDVDLPVIDDHDAEDNNGQDDEMELRVSISSTFLHLPPVNSGCKSNSSSSTTSSSPMFSFGSPARIDKMQFPAAAECVVNTLRMPSHVDHGNGDRLVSNNHLEMEFLRPSRPSIGGMNNGMMMKVFIKFRDLKFIKTFIASLLKASNPNYKENKAHQSLKKFNFPQKAKIKQQGDGEKSSRRILEINLDSIRGVFGRKTQIKGTKSCSTTKSSPLHQNPQFPQTTCANDNSIQGAIAHCKRSFPTKS